MGGLLALPGMYIVQKVRRIGVQKKIGLGKKIGPKYVKKSRILEFLHFLGIDLGF